MSTSERAILSPNMNEGRFFISPILGCNGGCSYCYLEIKDFEHPRKNELTVTDATFLNSLRIGNFAWKPRANGNLSLVYVGGEQV